PHPEAPPPLPRVSATQNRGRLGFVSRTKSGGAGPPIRQAHRRARPVCRTRRSHPSASIASRLEQVAPPRQRRRQRSTPARSTARRTLPSLAHEPPPAPDGCEQGRLVVRPS